MSEKFDPRKRFDERAADYDSDIETVIPGYISLHETSYYILKSYLGSKAKILIGGAGTGYESILYSEPNPEWSVTGFDLSVEMIKRANTKIKNKGLEERVTIHNCIISDIAETDFDAAVSVLVMHFIEDKKAYLENIYRRLKPGGVLLLADITGKKDTDHFNQFLEIWKNFQKDKRKDKEKIEDNFKNIRENLYIIPDKEMISVLESAGFYSIRNYYRNLLIYSYLAEKT